MSPPATVLIKANADALIPVESLRRVTNDAVGRPIATRPRSVITNPTTQSAIRRSLRIGSVGDLQPTATGRAHIHTGVAITAGSKSLRTSLKPASPAGSRQAA